MPSRISSSLLFSTSPKNAINISAYNLEILLLKWRGHRAGCTFLNFFCIGSVSSRFCLCVCLYAALCFVLHKILDFIFLKNMKLHTLIFYLFIFITMCIFFCMHISVPHVWMVLVVPEKCTLYSGTGATNSWEPPYECWKLNSELQEEHQLLLIAELFLQSLQYFWKKKKTVLYIIHYISISDKPITMVTWVCL